MTVSRVATALGCQRTFSGAFDDRIASVISSSKKNQAWSSECVVANPDLVNSAFLSLQVRRTLGVTGYFQGANKIALTSRYIDN